MDAQWLKYQFKINPGKNKADLARMLHLDPPAISKILNGARQIKAQEYISMRRFFGLPSENDGASSRIQESMVLQPIQSQSLREAQNGAGEWMIPADILSQRTKTPSDKIRIFKVEDSTMEPEFMRGEHVLVDTLQKAPSPPGAFLVFDGVGHVIRDCAYEVGATPPRIQVSARAQKFPPQILPYNDLDIAGRVIAKLQWL